MIPEVSVPAISLGINRWALHNGDLDFDTVLPPGRGRGLNRSYNIADTGGCSCEQIIDVMDLGQGHVNRGCSIDAINDWVEFLRFTY